MRFKNAFGDSGRGKRLNTDLGVSRQVPLDGVPFAFVIARHFTLAWRFPPVSWFRQTELAQSAAER